MTILITGATKGIGRAIAEKFAEKGFELAICARNAKDVAQFEQYLTDRYKTKVIAHSCDASDRKQIKSFVSRVKKSWKRLDVLVNNAGTFQPGNVTDDDGVMEELMDVNFFSAYYFTNEVLPLMTPHKDGHIFNMCSVASLKAYPSGGCYSVSKHALLGLSRALREELKPHNIQVTSLFPGATYTSSWASSGLPEKRFMDVKDLADIIYSAYMLSDRSVVEEIVLRPMLGDI